MGLGSSALLTLGEIELNRGSGYYGTYTVEFTGGKGNLSVAQMGSSTSGVSIATTTQGAKEWVPDTGINPRTVGANQTTVLVGGTLNVSCTGASDLDQWTEAGTTGQSADSLTYTWSNSTLDGASGTFTGTGPNVTWQAPTKTGIYTLRCEVEDGGTLPSGDAGNRDDNAALTNELNITVIDRSEAQLRLYPDVDPATDEPKYDPVGGPMRFHIYIKVANGERIDPAINTVTLRIREEEDAAHGVAHDSSENHVDFVLDLTSASGWKQWSPGDPAWATAASSPKTANTNGHAIWYTNNKITWLTTSELLGTGSKLLGHNGAHSLSLAAINGNTGQTQLSFQPAAGGDSYTNGPAAKNVNVQNLVIKNVTTSAGNPDYFKFDPAGTSSGTKHPTIDFNIHDTGDPHRYVWKVWIYKTELSGGTISTSDVCARVQGTYTGGGTVHVEVNDAAALAAYLTSDPINDPTAAVSQNVELTDWGTYAFDISISKVDSQSQEIEWIPMIRSSNIKIPQYMPAPTVDDDGNARLGHDVEGWSTETEPFMQYASYYLESNRDASEFKVDYLNPQLDSLTSLAGASSAALLQAGTPHLDIELYTPLDTDPAGTYIGVFTAADSYKEQYREHDNRRMLAMNQRKLRMLAATFAGPGVGEVSPGIGISDASITRAVNSLKRSGYITHQSTVGPPSYTAIPSFVASHWSAEDMAYWMPKSRVAFFSGHGNGGPPGSAGATDDGGIISVSDGHNFVGKPGTVSPFEDRVPQYQDGRNRFASKLNLNGVRAVIYQACWSAHEETFRSLGNIAKITAETAGADYAVGWDASVSADHLHLHSLHLWQALTMGQLDSTGALSPGILGTPNILGQACEYAKQRVRDDDPEHREMYFGEYRVYTNPNTTSPSRVTNKVGNKYVIAP